MDELQNNNPEQRDEIEILEKNVEEKSNKDDAEKQKNDVPKYASGKVTKDSECKVAQNAVPTYDYMTSKNGNLVCPRCGKEFSPRERTCPYCGLKNNMKLCKLCGATIAKNAKRCPKCGKKQAKPIYDRGYFWVIVVIVSFMISVAITDENSNMQAEDEAIETTVATPTATPQRTQAPSTPRPTSTPKATETPKPDDVITGSGRMITISSADKPVLGTWKAYCYYDKEKESATLTQESPEKLYFKLVISSDSTGKMYTTYGSDLYNSFDWSYAGINSDGERVYEMDGTDYKFAIIGEDSDLGDTFGGMLALNAKNLLILFEKS